MGFSDQQIEELRDRADLVQAIGRRVNLRKAGKDFTGLCPFHGEKTPSFYVVPAKRMWHCFGCGESGDVFKFFMKLDGMSFVDALKQVATESGFVLEEERHDPAEAARKKHLDEIATLLERAVKFYEQKLTQRSAQVARDHLKKRGISDETVHKWHLGFAGTDWDGLSRALAKAGVDENLAVEAGLCAQGKRGFFDFFHHRLIIPIRVPRPPDGKTVALGGRYLEGAGDSTGRNGKAPGKYINSRETPLYSKGSVLFGLDHARDAIRKEERAVIVEGYFDVIGVHQAGFPLAVATCGTSLTPGHLDLLARTGAKEIVFLFDGDAAGTRASLRAAEMCAKAIIPARVATLPAGKDPDDFARERGVEGLQALLDRARPVVQVLIDRALTESGPNATVEERVRAIGEVRSVVQAAPDKLTRELYVHQIAERLSVSDGAVREALEAPVDQPRTQRRKAPEPEAQPPEPEDAPPSRQTQFTAAKLRAKSEQTRIKIEVNLLALASKFPRILGPLFDRTGILERFTPILGLRAKELLDLVSEEHPSLTEAELIKGIHDPLSIMLLDAWKHVQEATADEAMTSADRLVDNHALVLLDLNPKPEGAALDEHEFLLRAREATEKRREIHKRRTERDRPLLAVVPKPITPT